MKTNSKLAACAIVAAFALSAGNARAQSDFPNKAIHFIVGFAAGGGNDIFARLVVQKFQENTGATTVIENKVGASARININVDEVMLPGSS